MLVCELVEALSGMSPDDEVLIAHPANDYWKTTLASPIVTVEEGEVKDSAYHDQKVVGEDEDADGFNFAVLISTQYLGQ